MKRIRYLSVLILTLNSLYVTNVTAASNFCSEVFHQPLTVSLAKDSVHDFAGQLMSQNETKRLTLFIDYDGTLVAIQKRPEMAVLSVIDRARIQKWSQIPWLDLVIVSGRDSKFLDAQFAGMNLNMAAEHGAEFSAGRTWQSRVQTPSSEWYPEVQNILSKQLEKLAGASLELKKHALVIHYRESTDIHADQKAQDMAIELQKQLAHFPVIVSPGKKIIEVKSTAANKGLFVDWYMKRSKKKSKALAIGDDRTDEDMFRVLKNTGLSINIGNEQTTATNQLKEQTDLLSFLDQVLETLQRSQP